MVQIVQQQYDVLVVGGGNAALCAAITAAEQGATVLLLESAPKSYRGGNSRHTRNFRCMHKAPISEAKGVYLEEEYFQDLLQVTEGNTDEALARFTIQQSESCVGWMEAQGLHFQPALSGTLSLSRTNLFFMGGGKSLVNTYYRRAQALGISVLYEANVTDLVLEADQITSVEYTYQGAIHRLQPASIVVASGGFQANLDWLAKAWGPAAKNFLIRGTPYNVGTVLENLMQQGVATTGDPTQCHAVAIDARAPAFDGGIVTRLDCVPLSVVVNKHGVRFYDEGEDVWPKRYAIWGRLVADQPDQQAYVLFDAKMINDFIPSAFPPIQANSVSELAEKLELPIKPLRQTLEAFNEACPESDQYNQTTLDGLSTQGISPPKSNWARSINQPPFYGYPLRPGVTFTYLGLKVGKSAQCYVGDVPVKNLWAAGEIMAGSILGKGYMAGFGMTIGTVFGRIAGQEAASHAS